MKIHRRTFPGGYSFIGFAGEPGTKILSAPIVSNITIPLKQGFGQQVPAIVKRGDQVKAGQIIGRDDETVSTPIHASVNGTVDVVKRVEYFGEKVWMISITPAGTAGSPAEAAGSPDETADTPAERVGTPNDSHDWQPLEGHSAQWADLPRETLEELLYLSGVTGLGTSGIPTRFKSSILEPADVEHIIVHHANAEVFNPSLDILLQGERLKHFVEGLKILTTVMPNAKLHVALSSGLVEWLYDIEAGLKDDRVSYYSVKPKYPQQQDEVLIKTLLKKKVPYNRIPADIGVLTFTLQDVLHVYEAVVQGKPLIERLVMLAGPGFKDRPYMWTRIGTAVQDLIASRKKQDKEYRIVLNSLLNGTALSDLNTPVTREYRKVLAIVEKRDGDMLGFAMPGFRSDSITNTFAARFLPFIKKRVTTNINGEKRGCISCGFCSDCCPVRIYPNLLHRYAEREKFDEPPVRYGIFDCIDCNLCTYVCTSKIPVAELIKYGKEKLVEEGFQQHEMESFVDLTDIEEYRGLP
jgi:Na(+)-translocating NADH:ubiquinone oxidoreductase A subunit